MLRSIFIALAVAASLFALSLMGELPGGALVRASASVVIGVMVATLAYGDITWMTVAAGALSPLALAAVDERSLGLATAATCFLWLAPRFVLAETRRTLAILVAASAAACLIGGFVFAGNIDGTLSARIASCVFAGSCLSLVGILVPVDTTVAWALKTAAAAIKAPIHETLERAARAHQQGSRLSSTRAKRDAWRGLTQLADRRAAIERMEGRDADEARSDLDERISTQVAELAPLEVPATAATAKPQATAPEADELEVTVDDSVPVQGTLPGIERETAEP